MRYAIHLIGRTKILMGGIPCFPVVIKSPKQAFGEITSFEEAIRRDGTIRAQKPAL